MIMLTDVARQLQDALYTEKVARDILDAKTAQFEEDNAVIIKAAKDASATAAAVKEIARKAAVAHYEMDDSSKKLPHGFGIRVTRKVEYDANEAFNWAFENTLALKLDERAFKELALSDSTAQLVASGKIEALPVNVVEVATATIPKVLKLDE